MMEHTDGEVWEKNYRDVFFGDPKVQQAKNVSQAKLAPAVPGQQGSLNIAPKEKKAVTPDDLAGMFGRVGSAGRPDPNKTAIAAKARAKARLSIGTDESGNLTVDGAGDPPTG